MSESVPDPNLNDVESALRGLLPAPLGIARDRMLYEAGRRSVRRGGWPFAAGAFALLSLVLGWHSLVTPEPAQRPMIVQLPSSPAPPSEIAVRAQTSASVKPALVELLLLGAPDYVPAQPVREREIEQWLYAAPPNAIAADATPPLPLSDRFGLPPGTLGNPRRPTTDFGPIRRGDA